MEYNWALISVRIKEYIMEFERWHRKSLEKEQLEVTQIRCLLSSQKYKFNYKSKKKNIFKRRKVRLGNY